MEGTINQSENVAEYLAVPAEESGLVPTGGYVPMEYQGGPLLSGPEFVSLYWGEFDQSEIDGMQAWLAGFAGYLNGVGARTGREQVVRQYGTVGATVGACHLLGSAPASATEADVKAQITSLQASAGLPDFNDERIFLVFSKGISFAGLNTKWCAYHGHWGQGRYFAICPYPSRGCAGHDATASWEGLTCHEILETCTDPIPGHSWVEGKAEGGDTCDRKYTTLSFGTVQLFADNQQQKCSIWTPLTTPHLCAAAPRADRLDVFFRGSDGSMSHRCWDGSNWDSGENLGGSFVGTPAVASRGADRFDVVVQGSDGAMWHLSSDGSQWGEWESLGGVVVGTPLVAASGSDLLDVFSQGTDGALWHRSWNGTRWGNWESIGGLIVGSPRSCSPSPGNLHIFARGVDGAIWHRPWDGTRWGGWESIGGMFISDPMPVCCGPSRIDVFAGGTDGAVWHATWDGSIWAPWESLGGEMVGPPAALSTTANRLDLFAHGQDEALHHKWWDGSAWADWENLGSGLIGSPVVASRSANSIDVFVQGADSALWHDSWDGSSWRGRESLGGALG